MENTSQKRTVTQWFFGEYSWTLKLMWVLAIMVCFTVGYTRDEGLWSLIVEGHFNSAFLLMILGYLSDFRYKFVKESRNN